VLSTTMEKHMNGKWIDGWLEGVAGNKVDALYAELTMVRKFWLSSGKFPPPEVLPEMFPRVDRFGEALWEPLRKSTLARATRLVQRKASGRKVTLAVNDNRPERTDEFTASHSEREAKHERRIRSELKAINKRLNRPWSKVEFEAQVARKLRSSQYWCEEHMVGEITLPTRETLDPHDGITSTPSGTFWTRDGKKRSRSRVSVSRKMKMGRYDVPIHVVSRDVKGSRADLNPTGAYSDRFLD